jgi:hypothetical protein
MIESNEFKAFDNLGKNLPAFGERIVNITSKPTSNLYNYLLLEVGLLILLAAYQMSSLH